jgi:hypothetical protein
MKQVGEGSKEELGASPENIRDLFIQKELPNMI